jgi:hypothetical protein
MFTRTSRMLLWLSLSMCLMVAVAASGWLILASNGRGTVATPCRLLTDREMAATFGDAPGPDGNNQSCMFNGNCTDGLVGGTAPTTCLRCNSSAARKYCCPVGAGKTGTCTADPNGNKQCTDGILQYATSNNYNPQGGCNGCTSLLGWTNTQADPNCSIDAVKGTGC